MEGIRTVSLNGLEIQARIGVYDFEREEDRPFRVDASIEMPASIQEEAVALNDTLNYETLLSIIQEEIKLPELLLETVANRIVLKAKHAFPSATGMTIHIQKKNPPLKAKVDSSSVKLNVLF